MKIKVNKLLLILLAFPFNLNLFGQSPETDFKQITSFFQALNNFSRQIPQEKVYLHFDNTSYYQGDIIWFKCYVVSSGLNHLNPVSKTLYVELLHPGGDIVDKRILKIENGQCHGEFTLNHLPFHSGFYEIRAYTRYMLNFGDEIIFSRLLPIFNKPKAEGNFEEKEMLKYGGTQASTNRYIVKREKPLKGDKVNLLFFPEGGNLIQGVKSRIAFEASDEAGNPIDITGVVLDGNKQEICSIVTLHEGKGLFSYTPKEDKQKDIAEIEYSGKKYRFNLPAALPQGVIMDVDNITFNDSIGINIRKNTNTPAEMLGIAIVNSGKLQNYCCVLLDSDEISFNMDKTNLFSGVSQIVLFNSKGEILCDRLIFTKKNDFLDIKVKSNKQIYYPFELAEMDISITDMSANPVNTTFSLSIRDGENEVENKHNILTDLLLMSEIKGYVRNPAFYFENKNDSLLDLLLMVQGWRRYSWKQMSGQEVFEQKYRIEQGIETNGTIVHYPFPLFSNREVPKPKVDVELLLMKKGEKGETGEAGEAGGMFFDKFVTDSKGRFSFVSDVIGKWNMTLTTSEKGKKKNYMILLDRLFSPEPGRYRFADLQVNIAEIKPEIIAVKEETTDDEEEDDYTAFLAYQDSLARRNFDEKVHQLPEVTVKAKKNYRELEILQNRSESVAYYDVASEFDDIYDRGNNIGNHIHKVLTNMNWNFSISPYSSFKGASAEELSTGGSEYGNFLFYKGQRALVVINYEKSHITEPECFKYLDLNVSSIKSIYINETLSAFCQYAIIPSETMCTLLFPSIFNCVVFIETYPDGKIPAPAAKGVRKTWLEGYSIVKEFYNPDYSTLPSEPDYRRTLYWNPNVTTDETGNAKVRFYNNSRSKSFSISAETVTKFGMIGVY